MRLWLYVLIEIEKTIIHFAFPWMLRITAAMLFSVRINYQARRQRYHPNGTLRSLFVRGGQSFS